MRARNVEQFVIFSRGQAMKGMQHLDEAMRRLEKVMRHLEGPVESRPDFARTLDLSLRRT
jgi:hypothetical protein